MTREREADREQPDSPDRWSRLVDERDEARARAAAFRDERDQALAALERVVANESNHYARYWTPAPEPLTAEWLDATEAKMREALTDAFCDDAAAVMLTLIAEVRACREERERLTAALRQLEQWDILELKPDGHGAHNDDAPWARALIANALEAVDALREPQEAATTFHDCWASTEPAKPAREPQEDAR